MDFDQRVASVSRRVIGLTELFKAWTDEARRASAEARRAGRDSYFMTTMQNLRTVRLPAPAVSRGPIGDKRLRYTMQSSGHIVDILDRPMGYRGSGGRFMVRHTGPGGAHFGTQFAQTMPEAKSYALSFYRHANMLGG